MIKSTSLLQKSIPLPPSTELTVSRAGIIPVGYEEQPTSNENNVGFFGINVNTFLKNYNDK